jgi:hypothetical protein
MSDINLDFSVSNNNITFTVQPNDITITPTDIQLSFFGGGLGVPGGSTGQLQYNNGGLLGGVPNTSFNGANLSLGNISNIKISGGSNNFALITDGTGNLSWGSVANANTANYANYSNYAGNAFSVAAANVVGTIANANYAAYAGNVTIAYQPNITSLGNLTGLIVSNVSGIVDMSNTANITFGNVNNVHITGGTNGYVLQTDGVGNLSWTAQTGGNAGNGVPGGANTQIQYNDSGSFGGNSGFTFNEVSGNVAIPGNLSVTGNINIGALTQLTVLGTTTLQQVREKVTVLNTGSTGVINFDLLNQAIIFQTANATANFELNFRGNSTTTLDTVMSSNQSMTCTYINKDGAIPYYLTGVKIDGNAITPLYYNNSAPSIGTVNGRNYYTFNIIKTAGNAFTILAITGNIV